MLNFNWKLIGSISTTVVINTFIALFNKRNEQQLIESIGKKIGDEITKKITDS